MSYTSEVANWIESNTKRSPLSDVLDSSNGRFSTQRDSKQTALRWRDTIAMSNVEAVQKLCADEMLKLGYSPVAGRIDNKSNVIDDSMPKLW